MLAESLEEDDGACSSRVGDELRTLDDEEVAEKDCSNGFGSSAKSERVCLRTVGRGAGLRPLFS